MKTFCRSGSIRENHYYTYVKDDITIRLRELRDKLIVNCFVSPYLMTTLFLVSWLISLLSLSVCFDCPEPVMSPLSWAHKLALVVPQYSG